MTIKVNIHYSDVHYSGGGGGGSGGKDREGLLFGGQFSLTEGEGRSCLGGGVGWAEMHLTQRLKKK